MPDLIIQWALILQLEPIINRGIYRHAYCNVKGRGTIKAAKYVKECLKDIKNTKYCLKMDIKKYYDNVDGNILKEKLRRIIKCKRTLSLLDQVIDTCDGISIGSYTSQIFANFYLQSLDEYIKHDLKIQYYARYMDDMVLLGSNKRKLHSVRKKISVFLKSHNLNLNNKWQVFPVESRRIDFCGMASNHKNTHVRRSIFKRILKNIKRIQKGIYNKTTSSRYFSYNGWLTNSDSSYVFKKYIKGISVGKLKYVLIF